MNRPPPSDAFVFLGATGDLAYMKIFLVLQAMIRSGRLKVPIFGVAKAGYDLERFRGRARASLEEHGGGVDPVAFPTLFLSCDTWTGTTTTRRPSRTYTANWTAPLVPSAPLTE